jgi:polyhydroxybutyrate depolymerase
MRFPALVALVAFVAAVVAGCGVGGSASVAVPVDAALAADAPATSASNCIRSAQRHNIGGVRTYVPRNLPKHPALLLAFHGMHTAASDFERWTELDSVAAGGRFIVAYPAAMYDQRWQLNDHDGDDDVQNVSRIIDLLVARTCADPKRVYLTGHSNGAGFAFRAGCDLRDKVAAVAPVSGSYASQDECPAGPMPTLEIHGNDPWTKTVPRLITDMKRRNNCTKPSVTTRMASGVTHTVWPGCNLERIYNRNVGHVWPLTGPYNTGVQVWKFVSRYRLR